ncbi:MAG: PEP-CTERM sorting domain-containing protein [Limisphaerales bacterium]
MKKSGWMVIGALALGLSARADVLFQNNSTDLNTRFTDGSLEFGDQIFLNSPGQAYVTNFSFEYYGVGGKANGSFSGLVSVDVRWYLNNGTPTTSGYATPGTLVYDSGPVNVAATGPTTGSTLTFSTATGDFPVFPAGTGTNGWYVPGNALTFTVQFSGMGTGDQVGVDLYSPPSVGTMYADYWQNNGTAANPSWVLLENVNGTPVDIGQEWMGTAVPEPSALALSLVGGLGLLMAVRRFRNK